MPMEPSIPPNRADGWGYVPASLLTTVPLLYATLMADNLGADGGIGLPVYALPLAAGLLGAGFSSIAAMVIERKSDHRLLAHLALGGLASLILMVGYCGWWGEAWFRFAQQFRT